MKQQSIVATSLARAELHVGNRTATESMGVQPFAEDVGSAVPLRLRIDSSAALSMSSRTGLGKAKRIEIQHSWLQKAVRTGKLLVEKIHSETHSSDVEAPLEQKNQHAEEAREQLLSMNTIGVGFVLRLSPWIGDLAYFWLRSRSRD